MRIETGHKHFTESTLCSGTYQQSNTLPHYFYYVLLILPRDEGGECPASVQPAQTQCVKIIP